MLAEFAKTRETRLQYLVSSRLQEHESLVRKTRESRLGLAVPAVSPAARAQEARQSLGVHAAEVKDDDDDDDCDF